MYSKFKWTGVDGDHYASTPSKVSEHEVYIFLLLNIWSTQLVQDDWKSKSWFVTIFLMLLESCKYLIIN